MCSIKDLCELDVVSMPTGINLGTIDDICFDKTTAKVTGFLIYGKTKFFGILGKDEDLLIKWADVVSFGEDILLVNTIIPSDFKKSRKIFKIY